MSQAPYLLDKTNGYYITYDDEVSIKLKCQYAKDNDLGGVMIWEIGEDKSDTLITAVYDEIKSSTFNQNRLNLISKIIIKKEEKYEI